MHAHAEERDPPRPSHRRPMVWNEPARLLAALAFGMGILPCVWFALFLGAIVGLPAFYAVCLGALVVYGSVLARLGITESAARWNARATLLCVMLHGLLISEGFLPPLQILSLAVAGSGWMFLLAGWGTILFKAIVYGFAGVPPRTWSPSLSRAGLLATTAAFCSLQLLLQAWPGVLDAATGKAASILTLGSLGCAWCWSLFASGRMGARGFLCVASGMTVLLVTSVLLWRNAPLQTAFRTWDGRLDNVLRDEAFLREGRGWVGPWHVNQIAEDPQGGVYFRTWHGRGFMEEKSSGFVHRPNNRCTPFGCKQYDLIPMSGDWYVFHATAAF